MQTAAEELLGLHDAVGLQLTPGCAPTPGFSNWLVARSVEARTHHGFSWRALRRTVWCEQTGALLVNAHSIHPPQVGSLAGDRFWNTVADTDTGPALETMYPGYMLGTGEELDRAMDLGIRLAVDVSHLHMQWHAGLLRQATLDRIFDYSRIDEVHVSANDGSRDQHRPITSATFGLAWVRDQLTIETPVILESYVHRQSTGERLDQLELLM